MEHTHLKPTVAPPIAIQMEIPSQRIADLLIGALKGGSNYWYRIDNYHPLCTQCVCTQCGMEYFSDVPFVPGGNLVFEQLSDEREGKYTECPHDLNRETIAAGLKIMAEKFPRHFGDFISENDDAETADVFLQCCVLGDVIYG